MKLYIKHSFHLSELPFKEVCRKGVEFDPHNSPFFKVFWEQ